MQERNFIKRVCSERGSAMTETLVALLALAPFLIGVPLLGKQADIKHKTFDAARYGVWERTVWRNHGTGNVKSVDDITLETRDRVLGDPKAPLLDTAALRTEGITENHLWRDRNRERLIDYERNARGLAQTLDERATPVGVGNFMVPSLAHGDGLVASLAELLRVQDLDLNRRAFAEADVQIQVRPRLSELASSPRSLGQRAESDARHDPLSLEARGAILSDTWAASDESEFRRRVDYVTTNELIEFLETPARALGALALGRGRPLYGEGQFAWEPELKPRSTDLPAAYVERR